MKTALAMMIVNENISSTVVDSSLSRKKYCWPHSCTTREMKRAANTRRAASTYQPQEQRQALCKQG